MTTECPTPAALFAAARASMERGEERPTEWETAFHEAGHVVAQLVTTRSLPDLVYINDNALAGDDHAGRTQGRTFVGILDLVSDDPEVNRWIEASRRHLAIVLGAGQVARDIACGLQVDAYDLAGVVTDDYAGSDARALGEIALTVAPEDLEGWAEDAYREAERILREAWDNVKIVAEALVSRRRLTREDLWELLET